MGVRLAGQFLRAVGHMAGEVGRACCPWQWGTLATGRGRLESRERGSCYEGGGRLFLEKALSPYLDSVKRTCGMDERARALKVLPSSFPSTDIHVC